MRSLKFCPSCKARLSTRTIEGIRRQSCPKCGWVHYANPLPSAVAFVCKNDREVLLIKRGVEPGRGKWALPSGFVEAHELPEETALRELTEETNVKGTLSGLIGVYTEPTKIYGSVLLIAYDVKYVTGDPRASTDSVDAKFFPVEKIPRIPFASHRKIIRDGCARHVSEGMRINILKSKITQATITHTQLFYKGSMGIDGSVMKAVGLVPGEKVQVLNYNNGERLETYTIREKSGSGKIVLYGPASRKGKIGEKLCILSYASMNRLEAKNFRPKVVTLNSKNKVRNK